MNRPLRHRSQTYIWPGMLWAAACLAAISAPAAGATSCPPPELAVSQVAVVFVGTLTAVDATAAQLTFAVEEVWKSDDVPAVVVLIGSPGQWSQWTPTGDSYLVIANVVGATLQAADGCNGPIPWDASMAGLRPATAYQPANAAPGGGVPIPLFLMAGIVALIGAISFLAFRRTRSPA